MKAIARGSVVLVLLVASCRSAPAPDTQSASSASPAAATATAAADPNPAGKVAQVVFIGQREACPCTRKRIDTTWSALEQVLAKHPEIEVKKIEQDVDEDAADRYDELKSLMVAPGVYLMGGNGKLIQMLQGEVTVGQFEQALGASG